MLPPGRSQFAHRHRQRAFGMQPLEYDQPDHHPSGQAAWFGKGRLPLQQFRHPCFGNGLPISLEHSGQPGWPCVRSRGDPLGVSGSGRTGLSFFHSFSYRILKHLSSFMSLVHSAQPLPSNRGPL